MAEAAITERLKALIHKRGGIKSQITHFETFLTKYEQEAPDNLKLKLRLDRFKSMFEHFDQIQNEIELLDEETDHSVERFQIEDRYLDILTRGERLLIIANGSRQTPIVIQDSIHGDTSSEGPAQAKRRIKLPEAALPTFDGRYEDWLSFKDAFTSMIHSQTDLGNIEKLQYLKSSLRGEAARKTHVFTITESNYDRAWELLEKSYQNKRMLISSHLNMLLLMPIQDRENAEGLVRLADETQQHMQSLASLGVNVSEEIVLQNLENKLHKSTVDKWDQTLQRDVFPRLEDMFEFLYRTAARLTKRDGLRPTSSSSNLPEKSAKSSQQSGNGKVRTPGRIKHSLLPRRNLARPARARKGTRFIGAKNSEQPQRLNESKSQRTRHYVQSAFVNGTNKGIVNSAIVLSVTDVTTPFCTCKRNRRPHRVRVD